MKVKNLGFTTLFPIIILLLGVENIWLPTYEVLFGSRRPKSQNLETRNFQKSVNTKLLADTTLNCFINYFKNKVSTSSLVIFGSELIGLLTQRSII